MHKFVEQCLFINLLPLHFATSIVVAIASVVVVAVVKDMRAGAAFIYVTISLPL